MEGEQEDAVTRVYEEHSPEVELEEFREAVEAKVEQMGGLCDAETAAKLVAHEANEDRVYDIEDVTEHQNEVGFVGKVTRIGERRTFERDEEDEPDGRVANVHVRDETGEVRVALWDEMADNVDELSVGDVLKVHGRPQEGYQGGVEVSAIRAEVAEDEDVDVEVGADVSCVADVEEGMNDVSLEGEVIKVSGVNTFSRDDGSEGRVANLVVGDSSGWIRVTMWDGRADDAGEFQQGDVARVEDGYVREREGDVELHVGDRGTVEHGNSDVEFQPEGTPIEEVEEDEVYDLAGVVTDPGEVRSFDRDDGSKGRVRNVRIQDSTGELRVALWGEHADRDLMAGDEVVLTNVEVDEGWNDGLEGSANWNSAVVVHGTDPRYEEEEGGTRDEGTGLDSF